MGGVKPEDNLQQSLAACVLSAGVQLKPASLTAAEGNSAEERQQVQQQKPAVACSSPSYFDVAQAAASSWTLELKLNELQADLSTPAKQQPAAYARQQFQQAHRRYWDTR